jgi:hypothetical protein
MLALMTGEAGRDVHPCFEGSDKGSFSPVIESDSAILGRRHLLRGYRIREDYLHLAFPLDEHDERAWGKRLHLPLQLGLGQTSTASRRRGSPEQPS